MYLNLPLRRLRIDPPHALAAVIAKVYAAARCRHHTAAASSRNGSSSFVCQSRHTRIPSRVQRSMSLHRLLAPRRRSLRSRPIRPRPDAPRRILGDWREPTGSVIEIFRCGTDLCANLIAISKQAPTQLDKNNPDPTPRTHPLCGLQIGYGFHLTDPTHADGGQPLRPQIRQDLPGTMTADGNQLHLRGYVGIKAFGRTETWTRTAPHRCLLAPDKPRDTIRA